MAEDGVARHEQLRDHIIANLLVVSSGTGGWIARIPAKTIVWRVGKFQCATMLDLTTPALSFYAIIPLGQGVAPGTATVTPAAGSFIRRASGLSFEFAAPGDGPWSSHRNWPGSRTLLPTRAAPRPDIA